MWIRTDRSLPIPMSKRGHRLLGPTDTGIERVRAVAQIGRHQGHGRQRRRVAPPRPNLVAVGQLRIGEGRADRVHWHLLLDHELLQLDAGIAGQRPQRVRQPGGLGAVDA
jgi:hypothetical protein